MICVLDLGYGNLTSLLHALAEAQINFETCHHPENLASYDRAILPGVGAFGSLMKRIESENWTAAIRSFVKRKSPLLGICVGMQALFEYSDESIGVCGLELLAGGVKKITVNENTKLPHVGWNSVNQLCAHHIFEGIPDRTHSYFAEPKNHKQVLATTTHGHNFTCVVSKDNVIAVQFHPEKSSHKGLKLLSNFSTWVPEC